MRSDLKPSRMPRALVLKLRKYHNLRGLWADGVPFPLPQDPTDTWIDWNGSVLTRAARVREQIRRPDFGHLEIQVTVDDPKAYTKPWTVTLKQRIVVDTELMDEMCIENEQSVKHMK
jgi:hypothetical protein